MGSLLEATAKYSSKLLTLKTVLVAVTLAQRGLLFANPQLCFAIFHEDKVSLTHHSCPQLIQFFTIQKKQVFPLSVVSSMSAGKETAQSGWTLEPSALLWPSWLPLGNLNCCFFLEPLFGEERISSHHFQMAHSSGLRNAEKKQPPSTIAVQSIRRSAASTAFEGRSSLE